MVTGADSTQFYHHSQAHQQGFHTSSPYRKCLMGFLLWTDILLTMCHYSGSGNKTLSSIQKKLSALKERHDKSDLALKDLHNSFDEITQESCKALQKVHQQKVLLGLVYVTNYIATYFYVMLLIQARVCKVHASLDEENQYWDTERYVCNI